MMIATFHTSMICCFIHPILFKISPKKAIVNRVVAFYCCKMRLKSNLVSTFNIKPTKYLRLTEKNYRIMRRGPILKFLRSILPFFHELKIEYVEHGVILPHKVPGPSISFLPRTFWQS